LVSGGTDNHLVLVDLRSKQIDGSRVENLLENVNIYSNKNTVPGDKSALVPSGLRLGTPAMTTRGLIEKDFERIVELLDKGVELTKVYKKNSGPKLADFKAYVKQNENAKEMKELREEVEEFSNKFDFLY
jgi:glycine hydroxymethyltransferase